MISILSQRCATSLSSLTESQLKVLTERTTVGLYRDFHNIVMGITNPETTEMINNITETYDREKQAIQDKHEKEIFDISNKYIDEIHSMTLKMEKMKTDIEFESSNRIDMLKNMHNDALIQKDSIIENYKNEINSINIKNQELSDIYEKQKDNETIFYQKQNEEMKIKYENEINYFKQLLETNQKNLDVLKEDFYKDKSRTNIAKGNIGENLVLKALNDSPRYNDISIEDTSGIKGYGDLLVNIPSIDFKSIIEVKAETVIQTQKDLGQFDEHREVFFKEYDNSHAMFFSLKAARIPQIGSFSIINKNGSYTGYFANEDMNIDQIKYNFYNFIDIILSNKNLNNKNDNTISLCDNLSNNSNLFSEIVDDYQKRIKYHYEQIKICEDYINKCNGSIKSANMLLKDEGYSVSSNLICKTKEEKYISLKKHLIECQIFSVNHNKQEFKSNWSKKVKENELLKKEKVLVKFGIPKSTSYDVIFDEIRKIV